MANKAENPYYLLAPVSGFKKPLIPDSNFNPQITTDINVVKITKETNAEKYVKQYKEAIKFGDVAKAIEALKKLFLQRHYLFKALIESAVQYVGIDNLKLTELVFSLVDQDISGLQAILVTKLMAEVPTKQQLYKDYLAKQHETYYKNKAKKENKTKAELVLKLFAGNFSLEEVLSYPQVAIIVKNHSYNVLAHADERYHPFVLQVVDMKPAELAQQRKDTIELTKGTNTDRKLAQAMEEGKIN